MRRLLLPILLIAAGASAPNAQASWKIDRAQAIAAIVWHNPCDGKVQIGWSSRPPPVSDEPLPRGTQALAWNGECAVYLKAPSNLTEINPVPRSSFSVICFAILHEFGHLAGMGHSTNPRSVMFPTYHPDRRCRERGRPYLIAHGLL